MIFELHMKFLINSCKYNLCKFDKNVTKFLTSMYEKFYLEDFLSASIKFSKARKK